MYASIKEEGLLTTGDVCRKLGISQTGYHRLEAAGFFPEPKRWGKWPRPGMRVFTPAEVGTLRRVLRRRNPQRGSPDRRK